MIIDPIEIYNLKRNPRYAHKFELHTFEILEDAFPLLHLHIPQESLTQGNVGYFIADFLISYCQVMTFKKLIRLHGSREPLFSIICNLLLLRYPNDFFYLRGRRNFNKDDFSTNHIRRILDTAYNMLDNQPEGIFSKELFFACKDTFELNSSSSGRRISIKFYSLDTVLFLRPPICQ